MLSNKIDQLWKKLFFIGIGINVLSPILYTAIVYFYQQSAGVAIEIEAQILKLLTYILLGMSLFFVFFAIVFVKKMFSKRLEQIYQNPMEEDEEVIFDRITARFLTAFYIVICAICELPAIFGLVMGFMGAQMLHVVTFELITVAYFIKFSLKKSQIEEIAYRISEV